MVTTVLDAAGPANVEPLTGIAGKLAECRTAISWSSTVLRCHRRVSTPK